MNGLDDTVDRFTATTETAVREAQALARSVAAEIDSGSYGLDGWTKSMLRFYDIVARGSANHLQNVMGSCAPQAPDDGPAGTDIKVPVDAAFARSITVTVPFRQLAGTRVIPDAALRFHPGRTLPAGATAFRISVAEPQYLGAYYVGTVRLTRVVTDPANQGATDVPVSVAL